LAEVTTHHRTAGRRHLGVVLLVLTYGCVLAFWVLSNEAGRSFDVVTIEAGVKLLLWGSLSLVATMAMRRSTVADALGALGLSWFPSRGVFTAIAATAPMAIVALMAFRGVDPDSFIGNAVVGPLAEEMLFRGFLFGLLVTVAGWRLSTAIATSAFVFGLAHVRDAHMVMTTFARGPGALDYGIAMHASEVLWMRSGGELWWEFVSTRVPALLVGAFPLACGGAALAWITWRWRSLWPAIALHGLMNFWWDVGRSAPNELLAVSQVLAIVLVMALTALVTRRPAQGNGR